MSKPTGTVVIKRSRNGTTIRATGSAAQPLFDAMVRQAVQAANPLTSVETTTDSQPAAQPQSEAATTKGNA